MERTHLGTALLLGALLATAATAHETIPATTPGDPVEPRLVAGLGTSRYPLASGDDNARALFEQGLRQVWAFNHHEALRAFRAARAHDPDCALCSWGEAFALGPNINAPMDAAAGNPALAAVERGLGVAAAGGDPRVRVLLEALATRYAGDADRKVLDQRYAEAMWALHQRFPGDDEIAMLAVDALMNLSPWDYWEAGGTVAKGRIGDAMALTEQVLARNPDHVGAIHLYIHLTEASADPHRALPHADRLADLAPAAGHLVHMASHSYFRVGRYAESATLNKRAAAVDEVYLSRNHGSAAYASGYYPHNLHFVVASAQMVDDRGSALDYARRLDGKVSPEVAGTVGWTQPIIAARWFALGEYAEPAEVLALAAPDDGLPFVEAAWRYARGLAALRAGDHALAEREIAHIAALQGSADFRMLLAWGVPAPDVLRIERHVLSARLAGLRGDAERAIAEYATAADIQDSMAYMEPPFWYFPVRRALGEALLAADRPGEAAQAFSDSLAAFPGDPRAMAGLQRARTGRAAAAAPVADGSTL